MRIKNLPLRIALLFDGERILAVNNDRASLFKAADLSPISNR